MSKLSIKSITEITGRVLFIGDIHGCSSELAMLIKKFAPQKRDVIIAVGDVINKGPDSKGVLQLVGEYKIQCIQGNHERRLLRAFQAAKRSGLKPTDAYTLAHVKHSVWQKIQKWPTAIRLDDFNLIAVHGGFMPKQKWQNTDPETATTIQVISKDGSATKRSKDPAGIPWAEFWTGPDKVIYGHTPRTEVIEHPFALGLDTSCVYGGKLTGWVYPNDYLIEVPASKNYAARWENM